MKKISELSFEIGLLHNEIIKGLVILIFKIKVLDYFILDLNHQEDITLLILMVNLNL